MMIFNLFYVVNDYNFGSQGPNGSSRRFLEGLNGLTNRRKTAKNLVDSRKNWKIVTVSRKYSKKELTVKENVP